MDKIENSQAMILERLHILDRSIYVLNLVNNDLRHILHKQTPLPQFIHDSFKRTTISKTKTSSTISSLPPPPLPAESEEIRLAASMIDKAKRTIENVGEKKPKQPLIVKTPVPTIIQSNVTQNNRPKPLSSTRSSSAKSTVASSTDSSLPPQQTVRRYVPAHMKAPFLTQSEKKRPSSSSSRNSIQTNSTQRTSTTRRSISQQRRQSALSSSTATIQAIVEPPPQTTQIPPIPVVQNERNSMIDIQTNNVINEENIVSNHLPVIKTTEELTDIPSETVEMTISSVPEPIVLNRTLIKPLRRRWKQNQNLRLRLERELNKKFSSTPLFIDRLNEKIHSSTPVDEIRVPNIEALLQLAAKLRAIVLYLLETSTFDDLENALKRLSTLKHLVNQYHLFFTSKVNILSGKSYQRSSNINPNIEEWLHKSKSSTSKRDIIRYTDDNQLIAFTNIRFQQFENECRWIELNWHEQLIGQFKQLISNKSQNPLQIYRELMSLITGLQTSTPIIIENKT